MNKHGRLVALAVTLSLAGLTVVIAGITIFVSPGPEPSTEPTTAAPSCSGFEGFAKLTTDEAAQQPGRFTSMGDGIHPHPTREDLALKVTATGSASAINPQIIEQLNAAKLGWTHHRRAQFRNLGLSYEVTGWTGYVTNVEEVSGGTLVTLRISPMLQMQGGSATTFDHTFERYLIFGGRVEFVDGLYPEAGLDGSIVTD